jgi:hypothetical protein
MKLTTAEYATILAALRYWQREGLHCSGHEIERIATSGGHHEPLGKANETAIRILAICE